jgi:hypothetical protein
MRFGIFSQCPEEKAVGLKAQPFFPLSPKGDSPQKGFSVVCVLLLVLLLLPQVSWGQASCTPTVSTQSQLDTAIANASPGDLICLANGFYTSLDTSSSFQGTATHPITIRAQTDGQVTFRSGTSRAVDLEGTYGILEGVNADGGDNKVLAMRGSHWIVRRFVGWQNNPAGNDEIANLAGSDNLLEDCALFGNARIILATGADAQGPTNNTVRRCWVRWEYRGGQQSPKVVTIQGYNQSAVTYENVLATRDFVEGSTDAGENYAPFHMASTDSSRLLGSIAYATATTDYRADAGFFSLTGDVCREDICFIETTNNLVRDTVVVMSPLRADFASLHDFEFIGAAGTGNVIQNVVGITGVQGPCQAGGWSGCSPERHWGTSRAQVLATAYPGIATLWEAIPGICHRVINGIQTAQPLWPWPMRQRIMDGLQQSGREPMDVQAVLQASDLLGPLPVACLEGGDPLATSLAFVQQPVTTQVNTTITPPVTVEVRDQFGQRVTTSTASITVALVSGSGLSGTLTRSAIQGLATFNNLGVSSVQSGLHLRATSSGLTPATSASFDITTTPPPAGTRLRWEMQEGSPATTLTDTGDDATWTGTFGAGAQAPTWTTGITALLKGLLFAQASEQQVTASTFPWAANSPVTVKMWVKKGDCTAGCGLFHVGATNDQQQTFGAHLEGDANRLFWNYGNLTSGGLLTWTWDPGIETQWIRLGLVASCSSGSEKSIYVNGQRVATASSSACPTTGLTGLTLGMHSPYTPPIWGNFTIQDFTIQDHFSTPADMLADYLGGPPPTGIVARPDSMFIGVRH